MTTSNKQLVIGGTQITASDVPTTGKFMVAKFGISLPVRVKGVKGASIRDLVIAKGFSKDEYKAASKELQAIQQKHFVDSKLVNGLYAADPTYRCSIRQSFNKKGEHVGAVSTYRKEKLPSGAAATIAALQATIAQLNAKLSNGALPVA